MDRGLNWWLRELQREESNVRAAASSSQARLTRPRGVLLHEQCDSVRSVPYGSANYPDDRCHVAGEVPRGGGGEREGEVAEPATLSSAKKG